MAPTMFSYFKSRKPGSDPNSPRLAQWNSPNSSHGSPYNESPVSVRIPAVSSPLSPSPVSPLPPVLPNIPQFTFFHESERSQNSTAASKRPPHSSDGRTERTATPIADQAPVLPQLSSLSIGGQDSYRIIDPPRMDMGSARRDSNTTSQHLYTESKPFRRRIDAESLSNAENEDQRPAIDGSSLDGNAQSSSQRPETPTGTSLRPTAATQAKRGTSPSSSYHSFQKSVSSTNLATESSPASSRSTQPPSQPPSRVSKSRINLLNPVSLLKRRRTSQGVESINESSILAHSKLDIPAMNVPDDYDPRIKGNKVHDFSAPRPRRNLSSTDIEIAVAHNDNTPREEYQRQNSASGTVPEHSQGLAPEEPSLEKRHTPQFVENFDDADAENAESAVHRESLANPLFLARVSRNFDLDSVETLSAAKPTSFDAPATVPSDNQKQAVENGAPSFRISSDQSTAGSSFSSDTKATSPKLSPSASPSPTATSSNALEPPSQLSAPALKHIASNASHTSRFSFQLNSDRSVAQEKALEEKHKQKVATNAIRPDSLAESRDEYSDDDYGLDDMDGAGFEEAIPGVNADADDEDTELRYVRPFSISQPTHQLQQDTGMSNIQATGLNNSAAAALTQGIGLKTLQQSMPLTGAPNHLNLPQPTRMPTTSSVYSDDMYFDDGVIDAPTSDDHQPIDESMFDSPTSANGDHTGIKRSLSAAVTLPTTDASSSISKTTTGSSSNEAKGRVATMVQRLNEASRENSFSPTSPPLQVAKNTPSALEAYHSALASATAKAEAEGKFRRDASAAASPTSVDDASSRYDDTSTYEQFGLDEDLNGRGANGWDDSDEYLEDDPMIAAANEEALAADDSGFYGREFGFYGQQTGSASSEMINGGFFGSAEAEALARSTSGRNAQREPNLTPITERSEFSTRNSFISLSQFPSAGPGSSVTREQQMSSPGLKELAAQIGMDDEDMTLSQLMKLRKGAFASAGSGSPGSFSSLPASPGGSFSAGSPLATFGTNVSEQRIHSHHAFQEEDMMEDLGEYDGLEEEPGEDDDEDVEGSSRSSGSPTLHGAEELSEHAAHNGALSTLQYSGNFGRQGIPSSYTSTVSPARRSLPYPPSASAAARPVSSQRQSTIPDTSASSPPQSPPLGIPPPPSHLMTKFASRPQASSASYHQRSSSSYSNASNTGSDSVAYVREEVPGTLGDDGEGGRWYLEKRRTLSTGEVVVLARELVTGI